MAVKTFEEIYASLSADEKKLLDNLHAKRTRTKSRVASKRRLQPQAKRVEVEAG